MKRKESAVSPVIGVMLMLVVTLIIAAVVSGFAGGLAGSNAEQSPTMAIDVQIKNTGSWIGSGFFGAVTGVSEPIQTEDLKLVTRWRSASGTSGGATTIGDVPNINCYVGMQIGTVVDNSTAPYGMGPGVSGEVNPTCPFNNGGQSFGNYTLMAGTSMNAVPYGSTSGTAIGGSTGMSDDSGYGVVTAYEYTVGGNYDNGQIDPMQAVMGEGWEDLRTGDTVSVSIVHIPSGKTIFDRSVAVVEG